MDRDKFLTTLLAHFTHKQLLNEIVKHLGHAQLQETHDAIEQWHGLPTWDESDPDNYDESMDGDHQSALASAGFGTDEDYGCYDSGCDTW